MRTIVNMKKVKKSYDTSSEGKIVLKEVDLVVDEGEFLALMGPSGCGKTTLLNILGLIDNKYEGSLEILGKDIKQMKNKELQNFRKQSIGYIFQEYNLLDTLSVYDNIALALIFMGKKDIKETIKKTASILGIKEILNKYPDEISGGQKQRVAIARALVCSPKILLCDEPTGALDQTTGKEIIKILDLINKKLNITIIMVTHDTFLASKTEKVYFLKEGRFVKGLRSTDRGQEYYESILKIERELRS